MVYDRHRDWNPGGVLFAPKAGNETRTELVANAKDVKEKAAVLTKQGAARAGEYVQQGKEIAGQYLEQGKTLASDHLARASAALDAGKKAYAEGASAQQTVESTFDIGNSLPKSGV
jgi:gas vesicle protein